MLEPTDKMHLEGSCDQVAKCQQRAGSYVGLGHVGNHQFSKRGSLIFPCDIMCGCKHNDWVVSCWAWRFPCAKVLQPIILRDVLSSSFPFLLQVAIPFFVLATVGWLLVVIGFGIGANSDSV